MGRKGKFDFQKGFYGYVGSAISGLERRLGRHINQAKTPHWHIDYLLGRARILDIISAETTERKECALAQTLSLRLSAVAGFGCSDCKCPSHLFFCQDQELLEKIVIEAFKSIRLAPSSQSALL